MLWFYAKDLVKLLPHAKGGCSLFLEISNLIIIIIVVIHIVVSLKEKLRYFNGKMTDNLSLKANDSIDVSFEIPSELYLGS